ncbi:hypothetical protein GPA22_02650 [Aromatoleum toluvorans]|uniref:JAB domain-containing protein n=1 Tax=Aromatoleum toluvorans TaxID=92002 RepID=A0ABX1PT44_9RHOO|nr:Mov34/MPN/PAD-1 family protein [Aromatoleum toluvorans]NMG42633.1 hypothetical protein [Aromatoleum toluvorans]
MNPLWISDTAFQEMITEADRAYPLETGGVLVGYFAENGEPVVFVAVGPGPSAMHRRHRFKPDHAWQCRQLDIIFDRSSGLFAYLGDWHTHPDASPRMSWLDQRTLRSIARHPQARVRCPLMLIGGGSPQQREWVCHQYKGERVLGLITASGERNVRTFHSTSHLMEQGFEPTATAAETDVY